MTNENICDNEKDLNDEKFEDKPIYRVTNKFFIAGVQYHRMKEVINDLKVGYSLSLNPDPTNLFDPNAIKIMQGVVKPDMETESIMLGFVPKKFSSSINMLIEIGNRIECVITFLDKKLKPWEQCEVEIRDFGELCDD